MPVLAIGVATLDIVNRVSSYPHENDKIRALSHYQQRGGNAVNTLSLLSQLGHQCFWGGVLATDPGSHFIRDSLKQNAIDYRYAVTESSGISPISYITLSQETGSRTIVHHRQLREFSVKDFSGIDLRLFSWVHFEGRNVTDLQRMFARLDQSVIRSSLEVEKPREGIEQLFPFPDTLFFSRDYVQSKGFDNARDFLLHVRKKCRGDSTLFCAWGEQGAFVSDRDGNTYHSPAFVPENVVDTVGAGDVFNAGIIDGLLQNRKIDITLKNACKLAGKKCGQIGFDKLITG